MIRRLNHVAIAVADIDEGVRTFVDDLGLCLEGVEDVMSAQTRTAFLPVEGPTSVELVSPLDGQGPLVASLQKRGPGLHHLAFETDDIDADVRRLKAKGWVFTSEEPTGGAHGSRVIFVHPKCTGGVLLELVQMPGGHDA